MTRQQMHIFLSYSIQNAPNPPYSISIECVRRNGYDIRGNIPGTDDALNTIPPVCLEQIEPAIYHC